MSATALQQILEAPDGVRVRVWYGDAPGTPTLLVHGLSGTSWDWGRTVTYLSGRGGPLVALDLPGFGGSRWLDAEDYTLERLADVCVRTMTSLFAGTPFSFAGHSFAGKVGIVLAAQSPESVSRLLLADAGIKVGPGQRATRERFQAQPLTFPDVRTAIDFFQTSYAGESADVTELRLLEYLERTTSGVRVRRDPEFLATAFATAPDEEAAFLSAQWGRITAPTKVVRGGTSKMLTPEIVAEMQSFGPRVTYVEIADVGHNLPSQCPTDLARELEWLWAEPS